MIKVKMKKIVMMVFAAMFTMNVMADNVKFKVSNMHCENCANRAEKALKANDAVPEDGKVSTAFVYDAKKTDVEALMKALKEARFEAEVVKQCDKEGGCKHECGDDGCGLADLAWKRYDTIQ